MSVSEDIQNSEHQPPAVGHQPPAVGYMIGAIAAVLVVLLVIAVALPIYFYKKRYLYITKIVYKLKKFEEDGKLFSTMMINY